jgi:hypothetical protein
MKAFAITAALCLASVVTSIAALPFAAFEEVPTGGVSALKLVSDDSHAKADTVSGWRYWRRRAR